MLAYASIIFMASISVRKIDDKIAQQLRSRAKAHGVSMEEEVRQIITQAVSSPSDLGDMALAFFGEENGVELVLPKHKPQQPISFE